MKNKITALLLMLAFAIGASAQTIGDYIDIVYLKNGSKIKGIIVEQVLGKTIKIETKDGSLFVYNVNEVEKLAREEVTSNELNYMDNFKRKEKGFFVNLDGMANTVGGALRLTHGYRFGRFANFGLAVGLESLNTDNYFGYSIPALSLNLVYSGEILDKRITPFYQVEAGYGFSLDRSNIGSFYEFDNNGIFEFGGEDRTSYGGPMAGIALGVKFATKRKIYYRLALDARINSNFSDVTYYSGDPLSSTIVPEFYNEFNINPGLGIRFGIGF